MTHPEQTLLQHFIDADYVVLDDQPIVFKVGEPHQGLALLLASFGAVNAVMLTAYNPQGQRRSDEENLDRQMQLLDRIETARLNYFVGRGESSDHAWVEDSYLIFDLDRDTAMKWALAFDQAAWLFVPADGCAELVWTSADLGAR